MKLKSAISLAESCGLRTINEAITNVEIHSMMLFKIKDIQNEINEIYLEIEELSKQYKCTEEDILNWSLAEAKLYV